jgi:hypothetical protein
MTGPGFAPLLGPRGSVIIRDGPSLDGRKQEGPGRRRVARIIHGSVRWWILTSWNSGTQESQQGQRGPRERQSDQKGQDRGQSLLPVF